jgi:hypothetical protein
MKTRTQLQSVRIETLVVVCLAFFLARVHSFTAPCLNYPSSIPAKVLPFQSKIQPTPFHTTTATTTRLGESAQPSSVAERLKLSDRFDRWKFLQDVLDDFVEEDDLHQVLYAVLKGFSLQPQEPLEEGSLPLATPVQKDLVAQLLQEFQSTQAIPVGTDSVAWNRIEALLPDPLEDEDAFQGSWDTVMELHGREMVKVHQEKATERWRALSTVARVLIHYEFLTEGIRDES